MKSLTSEEYAKCFQVFANRTSEYSQMTKFMVDTVNNLSSDNINILSIGAGTGYFDKTYLSDVNKKINYWAIEPNQEHISNFENMEPYCKSHKIIHDYFTTDTEMDATFDLIIMSHCLYYTDSPIDLINHAMKFLSTDGQLIIFNITETGISRFVKKYNKVLNYSSESVHHDLSIQDITQQLKGNINYEVKVYPSYIDMEDIFLGKMDITYDILTFFIQTNTKYLDPVTVNDMIYDIKTNCDLNNKYSHPTGILIIK